MPTNRTKYAVDVLLNPESFPTEDKSVIWDNASGSFALGDAPGGGGGGTTITQVEQEDLGGKILGYDASQSPSNLIPIDFTSNNILVGELSARVNDNSRFQTARIVVGWTQESSPTFKISTVEDVRYPSQKVIFNINGMTPTNAAGPPTALYISFTQYKMGTTNSQNVTYTFNYRVF